MVIVLRPLEHDGAALEGLGVFGIGEIAVAEFLGDHAGLHDRRIEQIAAQHDKACVLHQRLVIGADHVAVRHGGGLAVFAHGLAVDGQRVLVDALVLDQLAHHGGHAAGAVIFLAEIEARRLHVHQQWHVMAEFLPVLDREIDADMAGGGVDVDRGVGRSADGGIDHDAVLERLAGEEVGRLEVFPDHLHRALAGFIGNLAALTIRRGYCSAPGQREAERFRQRIHRGRRAHGVAMADRRRGGRDDLHELFVVDLARGHFLARFPDHGAGPGALAIVPSVEHRPAGQHDGGNVHGGRRHHAGGGGLVAAGGQHHAVQRIAEQDFDQAEIGKVAIQRSSRALAGLLDRMGRELHGDAARFANAFTNALRQFDMMAVAGGEVVAGLRDADDRLAGLQLFARQSIVQVALQIECGHARIVGIVEPELGPELALFASFLCDVIVIVSHGVSPALHTGAFRFWMVAF